MPVSENEIAPQKTAPGEKHVRPPADFGTIKSAGGRTCFSLTSRIFRRGAIFFKCAVASKEGSAEYY